MEKKFRVDIEKIVTDVNQPIREVQEKMMKLKDDFDADAKREMSHILDEVDEAIELVEHLYQEVLAINPRPIEKLTYIELLQQTLVRLYGLRDYAGGEERKGSER